MSFDSALHRFMVSTYSNIYKIFVSFCCVSYHVLWVCVRQSLKRFCLRSWKSMKKNLCADDWHLYSFTFQAVVRSVEYPKWNGFVLRHNKINKVLRGEWIARKHKMQRCANLWKSLNWEMFTYAKTIWVLRLTGLDFPISAIFILIAQFGCWLSAN